MVTTTEVPTQSDRKDTVAGLLDQLGGIPAERVRLVPLPGTATEEDFLHVNEKLGILCELIDGTLVDKAVGDFESLVAMYLGRLLWNFVADRKLGVVLGADSMFPQKRGNIRMPDVCFIPKTRFPAGLPKGKIWKISPSLVVEVISASNTVAEITRKRGEFFASGSLVMWVIDPKPRTVVVYEPDREPVSLSESDTLTGGEILPGFSLKLSELFGVMDL